MSARPLSSFQGPRRSIWNPSKGKRKFLPCPTCATLLGHDHPSQATLCERLADARSRLELLKAIPHIFNDPTAHSIISGHDQKYTP